MMYSVYDKETGMKIGEQLSLFSDSDIAVFEMNGMLVKGYVQNGKVALPKRLMRAITEIENRCGYKASEVDGICNSAMLRRQESQASYIRIEELGIDAQRIGEWLVVWA